MNWNPGHFVLRFLQRKSSKVHSDQMVPAESDQLVEFDGIWGLNTHSAKCVFFLPSQQKLKFQKRLWHSDHENQEVLDHGTPEISHGPQE